MQLSQTEAYQSGIDGLPEPAKVTKHILLRDANTGEILQGDVETEASVRNRLAWSKGTQGPSRLFERYISARLDKIEHQMNGQHDWLCSDDCDQSACGAVPITSTGMSPAAIHTEEGFQELMRRRELQRLMDATAHLDDPRNVIEHVEVPDLEEAERMRRVSGDSR